MVPSGVGGTQIDTLFSLVFLPDRRFYWSFFCWSITFVLVVTLCNSSSLTVTRFYSSGCTPNLIQQAYSFIWLAAQMRSKAAASEWNSTFWGLKLLLVFWDKICWARKTSVGLRVFGLICNSSVLKDIFPSMSLAVFQVILRYPRNAHTTCSTLSTKKWGFAEALNS